MLDTLRQPLERGQVTIHRASGSATFPCRAQLVLAANPCPCASAAGALASTFHAKATTATIRTQLINVPGRLACSARRLRMHLPRDWPWQTAWSQLFDTTCGPPVAA